MSECEHGFVMNSDANPKYGDPWCLLCNASLREDKSGAWREVRGIPYSWRELLAASNQPTDEYHRGLMRWGARRIEALEAELKRAMEAVKTMTNTVT